MTLSTEWFSIYFFTAWQWKRSIPHKWLVLFAHADWLARRCYYSPPRSRRKTKWLSETKGAFLWEDPDQDFWSVAFLWSKSFFRSVIYRIHSGQGFIASLIWVICKRIIRSMLWVKDPKLITVRSGFGLELDMYFIYEIHFRICVAVKWSFKINI